MSDNLRQQMYSSLCQKGTDELVEIWQTNNHLEWTDTAFDVIQEILQERLGELPSETSSEPSTQGALVDEAAETTAVSRMNLTQVYFSFNGRINRRTFWLKGYLGMLILGALGGLFIGGMLEETVGYSSTYSGIPTILLRLFLLWVGLALTVKRWHDLDKSGWWILISFIPIVGFVWTFIETSFVPGTDGPNRYGARSF